MTAPRRPWGLIAGAIAVVLFAVAVISYAVVEVNRSEADEVDSVDQIGGIEVYDDYEEAQNHVSTPVDYAQSPPVGGEHAPPPDWADCTGTVYDVDVRHENAVHSLEHGAVWVTYDPEALSGDEIATLAQLVEGESGRMMSPYAGLDSPISLQAWGHQLKVDSVDDKRIEQFAEFLTRNPETHPEVGASCENPAFVADPVVEEGPVDGGTEPSGAAEPSAAESSEAAEPTASETPAP